MEYSDIPRIGTCRLVGMEHPLQCGVAIPIAIPEMPGQAERDKVFALKKSIRKNSGLKPQMSKLTFDNA